MILSKFVYLMDFELFDLSDLDRFLVSFAFFSFIVGFFGNPKKAKGNGPKRIINPNGFKEATNLLRASNFL